MSISGECQRLFLLNRCPVSSQGLTGKMLLGYRDSLHSSRNRRKRARRPSPALHPHLLTAQSTEEGRSGAGQLQRFIYASRPHPTRSTNHAVAPTPSHSLTSSPAPPSHAHPLPIVLLERLHAVPTASTDSLLLLHDPPDSPTLETHAQPAPPPRGPTIKLKFGGSSAPVTAAPVAAPAPPVLAPPTLAPAPPVFAASPNTAGGYAGLTTHGGQGNAVASGSRGVSAVTEDEEDEDRVSASKYRKLKKLYFAAVEVRVESLYQVKADC